MTKPTAQQIEAARRMLAHEATGGAGAGAAAAGRVYDKIRAQLTPLVGTAGVQALLARSAGLAGREFPCLEVAVVDTSTALRERLLSEDGAVATEAAAALFATLLALLTTFIGERLTAQALRSAWPMFASSDPRETPQ